MSAASLFTDIVNRVDTITIDYTSRVFQGLVKDNWGIITTAFSLYVAGYFVNIMISNSSIRTGDAVKHVIKATFVTTALSSWPFVHEYLIWFFVDLPFHIAGTVDASGTVGGDRTTVLFSQMDNIINLGFGVGTRLRAASGAFGYDIYILGLLVTGIIFILSVWALFYMTKSKMGLAVMLAVMPLFLVLYLFQATRGITEKYIQQCVTFALYPIFTMLMMGFSILLISYPLKAIDKISQGSNINVGWADVGGYIMMGLLIYFLFRDLGKYCEQIGSGFSLDRIGKTYRESMKEWQRIRNQRNQSSNENSDNSIGP